MPFSKIKTLLKILPILIFGFFAIGASAATEFVSIIDPDNAVGTDYTSLAAWEAAVQSDLTASSTLVFSIANKSGTTTDGALAVGQSSGATASVIHMASSSNQILLSVLSGTFLNGEVISTGFGTSTLTATGTPAIAVAKCRSTAGTADTTTVVVPIRE